MVAHTYEKKSRVEGMASVAAFEEKRWRLKPYVVVAAAGRYGVEVGHTKT